MDFKVFVNNVVDTLELEDVELKEDTQLEELDNWGSLAIVNLMMMADEQYSKTISPKEIRQCTTLGDLFELVSSK